jgi:hypothetical protein
MSSKIAVIRVYEYVDFNSEIAYMVSQFLFMNVHIMCGQHIVTHPGFCDE